MLRKFEGNEVTVQCNNPRCENIYVHIVPEDFQVTYNDEFGLYEPFKVQCDQCSTWEFFVMDFPDIPDEHEDPNTLYKELNQRKYVRDLMKKYVI
ncbi:hypothetical protein ACFFJY_09370 [Fictibacillus aquaticus]|uniref:Uncharacterized protein n=1 Tax=Fictibacillus aquaticus TaxID=2021314 RepID=A0A235FC13_9BACL|nr:hypothetical protein [Fictibacillus aquaticus]OYD58483.1 hypothetical protein CGZ90_00860 [Fictibacillus aquaticus]